MTVLGLTIGVAAFITIVSFADGARVSVMAQFESLGTRVVFVRTRVGSTTPKLVPAQALTDDDAEVLRRRLPGATLVTAYVRRLAEVRTEGSRPLTTLVQGSTAGFFELRRWAAESGGVLVAADETAGARLCVLGATVADRLFGDREAVGRALRVGRSLNCTVVGVLSRKGLASGVDQDDVLLVPVRTYIGEFGFNDGYNEIGVRIPEGMGTNEAKTEVRRIVHDSHGLGLGDADDFAVSSPDDLQRVAANTSVLLRDLLAGVALISLIVGGIGIMNMLLVAVTARTQEIGIRLAIGAPPSAVRLQFLTEAFLLSSLGTAVGVALGAFGATFLAEALGFAGALAPGTLAWGAVFGLGVGTAFGVIPARNASLLDPIVALRRE